jgi:predicted RNA-binding Zn ribbon-like protein
METSARPPGIRELPIVAGDLALDFANTVDDPLGPERYDHVADYRSLLSWSVRVGTLPEPAADALLGDAQRHPGRAAEVVRDAAALRDAINGTFAAVVDGTSPDRPWGVLRQYVADAVRHAELTGRPAWPPTELAAPLWPVAAAAYRLLVDPDLRRLKRCVGCPWLFLDRSKNSSRRWCSMEICGTDQKMRRYVAKRAARRRS